MSNSTINVGDCTKVLCSVNSTMDEVEMALYKWYNDFKREGDTPRDIQEALNFQDKTSDALKSIRTMVKGLILESVAKSLEINKDEL